MAGVRLGSRRTPRGTASGSDGKGAGAGRPLLGVGTAVAADGGESGRSGIVPAPEWVGMGAPRASRADRKGTAGGSRTLPATARCRSYPASPSASNAAADEHRVRLEAVLGQPLLPAPAWWPPRRAIRGMSHGRQGAVDRHQHLRGGEARTYRSATRAAEPGMAALTALAACAHGPDAAPARHMPLCRRQLHSCNCTLRAPCPAAAAAARAATCHLRVQRGKQRRSSPVIQTAALLRACQLPLTEGGRGLGLASRPATARGRGGHSGRCVAPDSIGWWTEAAGRWQHCMKQACTNSIFTKHGGAPLCAWPDGRSLAEWQ